MLSVSIFILESRWLGYCRGHWYIDISISICIEPCNNTYVIIISWLNLVRYRVGYRDRLSWKLLACTSSFGFRATPSKLSSRESRSRKFLLLLEPGRQGEAHSFVSLLTLPGVKWLNSPLIPEWRQRALVLLSSFFVRFFPLARLQTSLYDRKSFYNLLFFLSFL